MPKPYTSPDDALTPEQRGRIEKLNKLHLRDIVRNQAECVIRGGINHVDLALDGAERKALESLEIAFR